MNFLFKFFVGIDRTCCSDYKSLIFINTVAAVMLWEANKVQQQITKSWCC